MDGYPCPSKLAEALTFFDGGRVVVKVVEMPIKCPVAPLEFCFPADWFFHQSGLRDKVELTHRRRVLPNARRWGHHLHLSMSPSKHTQLRAGEGDFDAREQHGT